MAAVAPQLSVERFLQATNAEDYDAMARLFGTADGPVAETGGGGCGGLGSVFGGRCRSAEEVEQWMALLAEILRHDDYRIVSEREEPGRKDPARRIGVTITKGEEVIPDVAFILVRTEDGNWLVESIDTEKVAGA